MKRMQEESWHESCLKGIKYHKYLQSLQLQHHHKMYEAEGWQNGSQSVLSQSYHNLITILS